MLEPLQETENWVALAFLLFLGLLAYLGVHRKLTDTLDQRQARIKGELDEARRLREEAQALLAEFERKGREAEGEAAARAAQATPDITHHYFTAGIRAGSAYRSIVWLDESTRKRHGCVSL